MPLIVPKIDDRDYPRILSEALARIPVHTPEWTNFNDADPGVTLLQLFAGARNAAEELQRCVRLH